MKRSSQKELRAELVAAGARPDELAGLMAVADAVSGLSPRVVPASARRRFGWPRLAWTAGMAVLCLVIGAGVVMYSQPVLPGSPLYPVQKLSDNAALRIHPEYRGMLMVKRMSQMTALINKHASQGKILAAMADYRAVAAGYRAGGDGNYEILEFCHDSLQQAAANTHGTVRQAVEQSLTDLDSV